MAPLFLVMGDQDPSFTIMVSSVVDQGFTWAGIEWVTRKERLVVHNRKEYEFVFLVHVGWM